MSLRRETHPCWVATCDRCGDGDNDELGGSFHYASEEEARKSLEMVDWREAPDGTWFCAACYDETVSTLPCPRGGRCDGYGCGESCPVPATAKGPA